jgi:hypothetical protein
MRGLTVRRPIRSSRNVETRGQGFDRALRSTVFSSLLMPGNAFRALQIGQLKSKFGLSSDVPAGLEFGSQALRRGNLFLGGATGGLLRATISYSPVIISLVAGISP